MTTTTTHQELLIEGAGCASCVNKIETALQQVAGVEQAQMNFAQRTVETNLIVSSSKQKNIRSLRCHFYQGSFIAFSSRH